MRKLRRMISLLLLCTLIISQNIVFEAQAATEVDLLTVSGAATPLGAYSALDMEATADGSQLDIVIDFELDNEYLLNTSEPFKTALPIGTVMDPALLDAACIAASDSELPPISYAFTAVLEDGVLSPAAGLIGVHELYNDIAHTELLGIYTVTQDVVDPTLLYFEFIFNKTLLN